MKRANSLKYGSFHEKGSQNAAKADKPKSMKRKLFLRIAAISMGICAAFGGVAIVLLYRASYSAMEKQVSIAANAYSLAVGNAIAKYETAAQAIAKDDSISDPRSTVQAKTDTLDKLALSYGFSKVLATDKDGKTLAGVDISKTDCYQNAASGGFFISDQYTSELNGNSDKTKMLVMASRIENSNQNGGVVVCFLTMDTVNEMIENLTIGKGGFGFVVTRTGAIVADKNFSNVTGSVNYLDLRVKDPSYADMGKLTQSMVSRGTGGMAVTFRGSRDYAAYTPVSNTNGWSIAAVAVQSEMMSDLYTAVTVTLGLIVLFILLSVIASRSIAVPIVRPILRLVGRIETLAEGDLHTEVPQIRTRDEIQKLAGSFGNTVNSLNGYIREISGVLNGMADGNFTVRIAQDYKGDFVAIKQALNTIVESLNVLFRGVIRISDQVAGSAGQVAAGSQTLAQGASEQAGTIEELSGSLHQIASKVDQNAKSASDAAGLSERALEEVARGNEQMDRMIAAMARIDESSGKIEKVIKTIQDIAFQTNILALNAAVEAARAGEAGRGFSVVADEVRNLAGKSAEAVKVTSSLIGDTVQAVNDGRKDADLTARSFQSIIETVRQMSERVRLISSTAGEEASQMKEVNRGVEQISAVVQTTSATAEESAAASGELDRLAQSLKDSLGRLELLPQNDETAENTLLSAG